MKSEKENLCSICLSELKTDVIKLNCNHIFHLFCINSWKLRNNICPICRRAIDNNKKSKNNKSCTLTCELLAILFFIIILGLFCTFMILNSIKKLKLKKKGIFVDRHRRNKLNWKLKLFLDLFNAKKEDIITIFEENIKNIPYNIKNSIEDFFDNVVEFVDELFEEIKTLRSNNLLNE